MKVLVAIVVMFVGLAVLGVGYAMWSVSLPIDTTVRTGSVDVEWSVEGPGWDTEPPGKDVSSIECTIDGDTLLVTLQGAYPSIDYFCNFDVHSVGTIPVHLSELVFSDLPPGIELSVQDENSLPACFEGIQLHPFDSVWATLHMHLTNEVPNVMTTYHFSGEITAFQWNESPSGLGCPQGPAIFLLIDEDSIDNGIQTIEDISFSEPFCGTPFDPGTPPGIPSICVNDDIAVDAGSGLTTPLFSREQNDITPFTGLVLPTGQVQDEGLFSVDLSAQDLAAFIADTLPNGSQLDGIQGAPLGHDQIHALLGRTVCGKVHDSDVSDLGQGKLNATGAYMGLTAFTVTMVTDPTPHPEGSPLPGGSPLPKITVDLLPSADVQTICESARAH